MARLLVFGIIIWLAYFVAKSIWKSLSPPSNLHGRAPGRSSDAELIQDPQCGAYFMKSQGIKGIVDGRVMHFCSESCYEKYLKRAKGEKP
jgi:YHS domain-containing protein